MTQYSLPVCGFDFAKKQLSIKPKIFQQSSAFFIFWRIFDKRHFSVKFSCKYGKKGI